MYSTSYHRGDERECIGGGRVCVQVWTRVGDERYIWEWLSFTCNTWVDSCEQINKRELVLNEMKLKWTTIVNTL